MFAIKCVQFRCFCFEAVFFIFSPIHSKLQIRYNGKHTSIANEGQPTCDGYLPNGAEIHFSKVHTCTTKVKKATSINFDLFPGNLFSNNNSSNTCIVTSCFITSEELFGMSSNDQLGHMHGQILVHHSENMIKTLAFFLRFAQPANCFACILILQCNVSPHPLVEKRSHSHHCPLLQDFGVSVVPARSRKVVVTPRSQR